MTEQQDLPSDSDESDLDFKPSDEDSLPSEEDSDGSVEETPLENEEEKTNKSTVKRKKKQVKRRKKIKKKNTDDDDEADDKTEETEEVKKLTVEEEKKKTDSLWSDFIKDSTPPARKTHTVSDSNSDTTESKVLTATKTTPVVEKENKAVVTKIFEFAGEQIKVEEKVAPQPSGRGKVGLLAGRGRGRGGVGGLSSLIGQLGKKNKLSTLEKSKLDWERFKEEEGIKEDIQTHNKGKDGYLEKQDFLQRTDLRQFEIEKQLRTTSRSNR